MIKKLKFKPEIFGLIFTIASALFCLTIGFAFFTEERLQPFQYNMGIDSMGALICAALYYGCMRQEGSGIKPFRILIILVCACFVVNEVICYTVLIPEYRVICFVFCLLSKLTDLGTIFFFYLYVRETLGFKGKLAKVAEKLIPILLIMETLIMLSNIITPVTFTVTADGMYHDTEIFMIEEIFLGVTAILTIIMVFISHNLISQKIAALTFIFLPIIEYAIIDGEFGDSGQYGIILMSLIIMYCVISNVKSRKLAATQTDLQIASKIQTNALPPVAPEFPNHPNVNLRCSMHTAKEVGGDFYDYFVLDENRVCFLIADVSGKGTPAALFMMTAKTMIKDYALTKDSTSEIFNAVNVRLCENNEEGMFATAWIGIVDTRTMTLQYTNAGHNYPMLLRRGKPCEELKTVHGLFLAGMEYTCYKQTELQLEQGDRILLFTDGVTEAHNRANALYGEERLKKVLESTMDSSGEQVLDSIFKDVNDFAGDTPQFDDITMVVLSIK